MVPDCTNQVESFNLWRLMRRTAIADRRKYLQQPRSLSAQRLLSVVTPNLQKPIFLVGAPRSGTTFLGSCLAQIPEISYHFEPIATKAAARYVYQGEWGTTQASWFYHLVYAWLMGKYLDGDLRFAEKTPRNCFLIDFLFQAFGDAQFVHIIRDGRDAALSYSKKPWLQAAQAQSQLKEPGGYRFGPYARFWVEPERKGEFESTSDIHRCIWAWRRHTQSALNAGARLRQTNYHELRYEALVTNPAQEAERLLNFLGITSPQSRQFFYQAVAQAQTNSVGLGYQELSSAQLEQIDAEAGELLEQLNY